MTTDLSTHPLIQHYLTILRDRSTQASDFRRSCKGITEVIMVEAARLLSLDAIQVQTPLEIADGAKLSSGVVFPDLAARRPVCFSSARARLFGTLSLKTFGKNSFHLHAQHIQELYVLCKPHSN